DYQNEIILTYLNGSMEGIIRINKDESFIKHVDELIAISKDPKSDNLQTSAYFLYQKLIEPVLQKAPSEHLVIIPDGSLNYVNFEILIDKPIEDKKNYKQYNYLLKKHTITYHYASALVNFNRTRLSNNDVKFMGFAPYQSSIKPDYLVQTERSGNVLL